MNALEGIIDELNNQDIQFIQETVFNILNEDFKVMENYIQKLNKAIQNYEKTGVKPDLNFNIWEVSEEIDKIKLNNDSNKTSSTSSLKENVKPVENILEESSSLKNRPRRNASKAAIQNIDIQSNFGSSVKLRRPDSAGNVTVNIKKEKLSIINSEQNSELPLTAIKTEAEEMPAPKQPAPRKKKQKKTESKFQIKKEKIDEETIVDTQQDSADSSDVVLIENQTVSTVNLIDSDDNEKTVKNENPQERSRPKRTKKKVGKRTRTSSNEKEEESADKRCKSDPQLDPEANVTENNFEDALSHLEDNKESNNATFVTETVAGKNVAPLPVIMNTTVVLTKAAPLTADDLLTDDESEDEKKKKQPPKTLSKTVTKSSKQVFSPFEPSPVKKKVQAFERLREESNAIPVRITRTKTKAQAKEQEEENNAEVEPKSIVKEKAKMFTPMSSKFIPSASSTIQKASKFTTPSSSNESMSSKLASSLKASRHEYKERERIRKEQENEAIKKREAFLQAQIEEKKRKREEKQLRAQQQREALEKEKLKALEIQRLKEERHRQIVAEQEERKQKQKEEQDKKRLMAKMRAIEEKKKDEMRRLEEQKKTAEITAKLAKQDEEMLKLVHKQKMERERQKKNPIYLEKKPPLLPTPDCFDSDDEDNNGHNHKRPVTWDRKENLIELEIIMLSATDAVKNTFFSRQAQTPDLQDIFEVIEPRKLKRSSSAVWHKPPRYTMMPNIEEHDENNGFHTDDDDCDL